MHFMQTASCRSTLNAQTGIFLLLSIHVAKSEGFLIGMKVGIVFPSKVSGVIPRKLGNKGR